MGMFTQVFCIGDGSLLGTKNNFLSSRERFVPIL